MATPRKRKKKLQQCRTRVQALRLSLKLTIYQMSKLLGVTAGTYTSWEYGYRMPSRKNKHFLEEFFGEPLEELMAEAIIIRSAGKITVVQV